MSAVTCSVKLAPLGESVQRSTFLNPKSFRFRFLSPNNARCWTSARHVKERRVVKIIQRQLITDACVRYVNSMVQRSSASDRSGFSSAQRSQGSQDSDHKARTELGRQESIQAALQTITPRVLETTSHYHPKAYR